LMEVELLVHQKKWSEAKSVLKFIENLGDSGSLLAGQICWIENDADCAIRQAEQVLERNPDSFLALELRARGLLKSLRREEARLSVDRLAQVAPLYLSTLQLKREMQ
ncbi:MAG: hypothetical protein WCH11_02940, partial [Bdellovibrio sp.]